MATAQEANVGVACLVRGNETESGCGEGELGHWKWLNNKSLPRFTVKCLQVDRCVMSTSESSEGRANSKKWVPNLTNTLKQIRGRLVRQYMEASLASAPHTASYDRRGAQWLWLCVLILFFLAGWLCQKGSHWWEGHENGQLLADGMYLQLPRTASVWTLLFSWSFSLSFRKMTWSQSSSRSSLHGLRHSQLATHGWYASQTDRTWTEPRWPFWSTKATPSLLSTLRKKRMNWRSSTSYSKATERRRHNS